MIKSMKSPRRLAAVAVFAIVAMSAFGFAATNAVPDSVAGDGAGDVSGITVTDIDWVLDTANPAAVTAVNLQFTGTPGNNFRVTLRDGANLVVASTTSCTVVAGLASCTIAADVEDVFELQVTTWDND